MNIYKQTNSSRLNIVRKQVQADRYYRYMRALAAMYIRMTFRAVDVYGLLEPLLKDYRKLRVRSMSKVNSVIEPLHADRPCQKRVIASYTWMNSRTRF